ncbi:MAG TPA: PIN domain-containing protein [bacterium]|nr:PIN domain-containing protein [bacterium]
MTFKIFIDSDIILDVLSKREPFYNSAAILFSLIEKGRIKGYSSSIIFSNVHYVLRKRISKDNTITSLKYLKSLLEVLPVDKRAIESALDSEFDNFEDAIQYFCAEQNGINYFITRNKIDYEKAQINILTAKEFLSMLHTLNIN